MNLLNQRQLPPPRLQAHLLSDGRRLHLVDGPIDLVIDSDGARSERDRAFRAAQGRLEGLLDDLCEELPLLRRHAQANRLPEGVVARRMWEAVLPHAADAFVTPMAAVAGAVAEAVLAAMTGAASLARAFVNNGGDIALHLAPGAAYTIGLIDRPDRPSLFGRAVIGHADSIRGIATSGWRGRSFSLGIADAVTVLATTAADADAAATMIANAVDLPCHPAVVRVPASDLQPDSDLRERLVTRHVGALTAREILQALEAGARDAEALRARGLIAAAALHLQGETRIVGPAHALIQETEQKPSHA